MKRKTLKNPSKNFQKTLKNRKNPMIPSKNSQKLSKTHQKTFQKPLTAKIPDLSLIKPSKNSQKLLKIH
jgi:hypothetical protein